MDLHAPLIPEVAAGSAGRHCFGLGSKLRQFSMAWMLLPFVLLIPPIPQRLLALLGVRPEHTTVLVTGYEPFGNMSMNPAEAIARALNRTCTESRSMCVHSLVLPVNRSGAKHVAELLAEGERYDGVIHLGFEQVSKGLRLEIAAANVLATDSGRGWSAEVPCNKTNTTWSEVEEGAPCLLATTAPLDRLIFPLPTRPLTDSQPAAVDRSDSERDGPLELWSRDAGVFYCNEVYYRTLLAVRRGRIPPARSEAGARGEPSLMPAVFVHVPGLSLASVAEGAAFVFEVASRFTNA